jgi:methyl-accepting chemotaxis protein
VDSQAFLIGALCGAAVSGIAVGLWFRFRLQAASRRIGGLEGSSHRAQRRIAELSARAADSLALTAQSLQKVAADVEQTLGRLAESDETLVEGFEKLVDSGDEGAEPIEASVGAIEQVTEEMAGRVRDVSRAIDELEHRAHVVTQVLDKASTEDRMVEHKIDDLVGSAGETVGAASTMDNVIRKLQDSAAETAELSTQVSTEAERGYRAVHRTLDEIERIRSLSGAARARIGALGDRVADIGHVVRVIQDITEKTNLLALNASIIAAQAGEHGRSFAVVANEIKALAQRTAASTKEISEQIRGVQDESERATSAMVDGVAAVGEGFQVAISAGDALDAIRQSARSAQKRVQSMTRTLRQQSSVTQQVVNSAARVSERASSFAAAIRDQSSLAGRLRSIAMEIHEDAQRIAAHLREHGATSTHSTEAIGEVVDRLLSLHQRERELMRGVRDLRANAARGRSIGDDLAAHWASVNEMATHLRERAQQLKQP